MATPLLRRSRSPPSAPSPCTDIRSGLGLAPSPLGTLPTPGQLPSISAISVAPGIVDTGMQADIRATTVSDFPLRDTFVHYHTSGQLTRAEDVAAQLVDLVLHHTMEQSGKRFDVRDLS